MLPTIETILYATDLGAHAPGVFRYAVSLARRYGAKLVLLHVVEPIGPTASSLVRNVLPEDTADALEREGLARVHEQIRERLERFRIQELGAASAEEGLVSKVRVVEGHPADTILREAEKLGAHLIVMGTHGRRGVGELMLGSVAHKVLQQSKVPVLVAPLRHSQD